MNAQAEADMKGKQASKPKQGGAQVAVNHDAPCTLYLTGPQRVSSSRASEGKGPELVGVATVGACTLGLPAPALAAPAFPLGAASTGGGGMSTCQVAFAVGCVKAGTCSSSWLSPVQSGKPCVEVKSSQCT